MEARARQSLAAIKSGPDGGGLAAPTVEALFQAGWRSAAEVATAKPDELANITGIGAAGAPAVIAAAVKAAEIERARLAEEAARAKEAAAALAEKEAGGSEAPQG
jgi:hypothetical protein